MDSPGVNQVSRSECHRGLISCVPVGVGSLSSDGSSSRRDDASIRAVNMPLTRTSIEYKVLEQRAKGWVSNTALRTRERGHS
jgi:hypothetical protein